MARKQTSPTLSKRQELIAALDQSRKLVEQDTAQLGDALNVSRKLEASFHAYRYWWIGGGLLTGLFLAKNLLGPLLSKSSDSSEKKSTSTGSRTILSLLEIAGKQIIRLSRPVLKKAVEKEVEQWLSNISKGKQEDPDNYQNR